MILLRRDEAKSRNETIIAYSPTAHGLLSPSMDPGVKERVKRNLKLLMLITYVPSQNTVLTGC